MSASILARCTLNVLLLLVVDEICVCAIPTRHQLKDGPLFRTVVTSMDTNTTKEANNSDYKPAYIDVQVLDKPHNLFIGRCSNGEEELHREKIILNNDSRSHVTGLIRLEVDKAGEVEIRCVRVFDEALGVGAYPYFVDGGVGYNFVEIGVRTQYGKGFEMFVQIFGRVLKH